MDETQPAADVHDRPSAGVSRLSPEDVAARTFPAARKGVAEPEVRAFLRRVADELSAARAREQDLLAQLERVDELRKSSSPLSEEELLHALGEETAAVLRSAREAAEDMRRKSEARVAALLEEAQQQAAQTRQAADEEHERRLRDADEQAARTTAAAEAQGEAVRGEAERAAAETRASVAAEAEAAIEQAKAQGRQILEDTKALRERILGDLTHRRALLQAQVEELTAGRDHLIDAYRTVRRTFIEATEALTRAEAAVGPAPEIDEAEIDRILAAELPDAPEAPADVEDLFARLRAEQEAAALVAEADELAVAAQLRSTPQPEPSEAVAPQAAPETTQEPVDSPGDPGGPEEPTEPVEVATGAGAEPAEPAEPEPAPEPEPSGELAASAAAPVATEPPAAVPAAAPDEDLAAQLHARLATLAGDAVGRAARAAKRAAQDEQNTILDAVRRSKGRPTSAAVLPEAGAQAAAWAEAIADVVGEAYAAGWSATSPAGSAPQAPDGLAAELASALVTPLRARLVAAIDETPDLGADTTPHIIERISARYREWKTQWAQDELTDVVYGAYSRGVVAAAAPGTALRWVNPAKGCSPDCADNALEPTPAGSAFPTGAVAPPAHPGCRCLLAAPGALEPI